MVREHVDEPVKAWLQKYGEELFDFSEMLVNEGDMGSLCFDKLYNRIEAAIDLETKMNAHPDLGPTCDSLIVFTWFCCGHHGSHETVVEVRSEKGGATHITIKPAKRLRGRKSKLSADIDYSWLPSDSKYCELCGELNEQAIELLRILRKGDKDSTELARHVQSGERRFHTPGFSPNYCRSHSPTENPVEYKNALERRELYGSMRRLIISARGARRLSGDPVSIVRTASFALADQCPNPELIGAVPALVVSRRYCDEGNGDSFLKQHLEKIVSAFYAADHSLTRFASGR